MTRAFLLESARRVFGIPYRPNINQRITSHPTRSPTSLPTFHCRLLTACVVFTTYHSLLAVRCSLITCNASLITHHSSHIPHPSSLITHHSPLTTRCPRLTTHFSLPTTHYPPPTTCYPPLTTHYLGVGSVARQLLNSSGTTTDVFIPFEGT